MKITKSQLKQIIKEDTIAGKLLGKVDVRDILTKVGLRRTAKDFWKNVKNLAKKLQRKKKLK